MIPDWLKNKDSYVPPEGGGTFAVRTIRSISQVIGRLKFQQGHEKKHAMPALMKLILLVALIVILSVNHNTMVLLSFTAVILLYLCTWPAEHILSVVKSTLAAAVLSLILLLPAMLLNPAGMQNNLRVLWKVVLSVQMVSIFSHTTQWNHITHALRKLHIPGVFIFTIDITLKYIVTLGRLVSDLLTSYLLRAVGNGSRKYSSAGGVMGVAFIRGSEMSTEMYEAMRCRGFTDDYRGL